jgi:uncharacterized membrane protein (DUF485 family)
MAVGTESGGLAESPRAPQVPVPQAGERGSPIEGATAHDILTSVEFGALVATRWRVSIALTIALFVIYYGYILLVATNRALLATRVGDTITLGIVLGVTVLVSSWVLTAVYVVWANRRYDPVVQRLRKRLRD